MNEIVSWARQWPHANVRSVRLWVQQADDENKERRNRLYEQFGLVFDYDDPERCAGKSRLMSAGALTTVDTWKMNIVERQLIEHLGELTRAYDDLSSDLRTTQRQLQELFGAYDLARNNPLGWALTQLGHGHAARAMLLCCIAAVILMAWLAG